MTSPDNQAKLSYQRLAIELVLRSGMRESSILEYVKGIQSEGERFRHNLGVIENVPLDKLPTWIKAVKDLESTTQSSIRSPLVEYTPRNIEINDATFLVSTFENTLPASPIPNGVTFIPSNASEHALPASTLAHSLPVCSMSEHLSRLPPLANINDFNASPSNEWQPNFTPASSRPRKIHQFVARPCMGSHGNPVPCTEGPREGYKYYKNWSSHFANEHLFSYLDKYTNQYVCVCSMRFGEDGLGLTQHVWTHHMLPAAGSSATADEQ